MEDADVTTLYRELRTVLGERATPRDVVVAMFALFDAHLSRRHMYRHETIQAVSWLLMPPEYR